MATDAVKQVRGEWVDADQLPIELANQFACVFLGSREFVLSIGQASPPILLGTDEEREEQLRGISSIPIHTIARLVLTDERIRELIGVLEQSLDNQSKLQGLLTQEKAGE
jgi:hypothetical protein